MLDEKRCAMLLPQQDLIESNPNLHPHQQNNSIRSNVSQEQMSPTTPKTSTSIPSNVPKITPMI